MSKLTKTARSTSTHPPATDCEIEILTICRRLLKLDDLSLADNFMESGGDSIAAMALVLEVESQLGFEISLESVLMSRSISELCAARGKSVEAALAVVSPIKSGPSERTLYFTHSGFDYSDLCDALTSDVSAALVKISGTKLLRELALGGDALAAVDHISSEYARAIFARHQTEHWYLAGHSFGGILALETACKLEELGAAPGIVFLFDTYLHGAIHRILHDIRHNGLLGRKLKEALQGDRQAIPRRARFVAQDTFLRLKQSAIFEEMHSDISINAIFRKLREKASQAYTGPRRPLRSRTVLFRATESYTGKMLRVDPDLGWARRLGANLKVVLTSGQHNTLLSREYAKHVAGEIDLQIAHDPRKIGGCSSVGST